MKLYKWKAIYININVKLTGIVFATDVDKAYLIVKQRLCDNGYDHIDLVYLKCEEVIIKPSYASFCILWKKKIKNKKGKKK